MNASDARALSDSHIPEIVKAELDKAYQAITDAAKDGNYTTAIWEHESPSVRLAVAAALRQKGYDVSNSNNGLVRVSWN